MAKARTLELTQAQQQELQWARDHHAKAYMRVKAAAILKVRQGEAIRQVAAHGLLKPVHEDTIRDWINRYLQAGLAALLVQQGRGRKPAFSPWA
jgi:transposase